MIVDIVIFALGILLLGAGGLTFIMHLPVVWTGGIIVGLFLILSRLAKWQRRRSTRQTFEITESSMPAIWANIIDGATPTEVCKLIFHDPDEIMIGLLAVGNCLSGGAFIASNFVERLNKGLAAARNAPPLLSPEDLLRDLSLRRTAYLVEQTTLIGGGVRAGVLIISADYLIFIQPDDDDWKKEFAEEAATINAAEWAKDAKEGIEAMLLFSELFDQRIDQKTSERLIEAFRNKKAIIVPLRAITDITITPFFGESSTFYNLLEVHFVDESHDDPNRAIVFASPPNAKATRWAIARLCIVCFACCVVGNIFSHIKLLAASAQKMKEFEEALGEGMPNKSAAQ